MRIITIPNKNNIYSVIETLEQYPALFLGEKKISLFQAFINGYYMAERPNMEQEYPPFDFFHDWAMHKYGWYESTAGWKNIILQENKSNEEHALTKCFELIKEFRTLKPISIIQSNLNESNQKLYYEAYKVNKKASLLYGATVPIFEPADTVYIIEFSHNFGFSISIQNNKKTINHYRLKTKEEAISNCQKLFGNILNWKNCNENLLERGKTLLTYKK